MASNPSHPADLGRSTPLVPPLYQSSVYTLPDLDTLDRIMDGEAPGFIYARDGHPNARHLAAELAALEKAPWGVVCASGMAAVSSILLATVKQGDRVVASNRLYGKTAQLLAQEFSQYGVQTTFVDANDLEQVRAALEKPARMLFVETMSNPLVRVVDLEALGKLARERDCLLVVDNTFATPVLCRPMELGAAAVIESLTKMIGGHSDVTLGFVCGRADLQEAVVPVVSTWGLASNPFDCWLAARGLTTLPLRMRAASENALRLAEWLAQQAGVKRVVYPGLRDHPDHDLTGRLLGGCYGNMLCFELEGGREGVNRFLRLAPGIPFSPSLGNTTTTLSHPATTSHRHVSPAEKRRQGIGDGLIRLSVGIEDFPQLQREMARGLA
jgi:cystathionine beta-lyase/cystathionine gamma-synthase